MYWIKINANLEWGCGCTATISFVVFRLSVVIPPINLEMPFSSFPYRWTTKAVRRSTGQQMEGLTTRPDPQWCGINLLQKLSFAIIALTGQKTSLKTSCEMHFLFLDLRNDPKPTADQNNVAAKFESTSMIMSIKRFAGPRWRLAKLVGGWVKPEPVNVDWLVISNFYMSQWYTGEWK